MNLNIRGKIALVTGGSRGIGRAIAISLAEEGCDVAICARNRDRVDSVVAEIEAHGVRGLGVVIDVMQPDAVEKVMSAISSEMGTVDILINNVGGGGRWGSDSVCATGIRVWEEVFEKNALVAVRFTVACLPGMQKSQWGRVINVSSIYGREGGGRPWFNMSKAAQISMMKCLGMNRELGRCNITFNSVAPGPIMIEGTGWASERDRNPDAFSAELDKETTLGRLGTPEEVASVVVFLCSQQASLVNGASLAVDGGDGRAF